MWIQIHISLCSSDGRPHLSHTASAPPPRVPSLTHPHTPHTPTHTPSRPTPLTPTHPHTPTPNPNSRAGIGVEEGAPQLSALLQRVETLVDGAAVLLPSQRSATNTVDVLEKPLTEGGGAAAGPTRPQLAARSRPRGSPTAPETTLLQRATPLQRPHTTCSGLHHGPREERPRRVHPGERLQRRSSAMLGVADAPALGPPGTAVSAGRFAVRFFCKPPAPQQTEDQAGPPRATLLPPPLAFTTFAARSPLPPLRSPSHQPKPGPNLDLTPQHAQSAPHAPPRDPRLRPPPPRTSTPTCQSQS